MKKLLLLALGLSLAAQNVNANLLTQDEADNLRKAATAVYVGSTVIEKANVDFGTSRNEKLAEAKFWSNQLRIILSSALERGHLAAKVANVLNKVNTSKLSQAVSTRYHIKDTDAKEVKEAAKKTLTERSKLEALSLGTAVAEEFSEVLADTFVNNKINNRYARRITRAFTYAVAQAFCAANSVAIYNYATAKPVDKAAAVATDAKKDTTPSNFSIAKDVFVDTFVCAFVANLGYEAAGEIFAELFIEPTAVSPVVEEEGTLVVEAIA